MSLLSEKIAVATYQKPKKGNTFCGDSYFYHEIDNKFICALADGLGSGEFAEESSKTVINVVKNNPDISDKELAKLCTKELMGQRGVVLGILIIDYNTDIFRFLSIGNIGLRTITSMKKKNRNIPNSGYLGGYQREFKEMKGTAEPDMKFILFSDGVADKELTLDYFLNSNVDQMISTFESTIEMPRSDDTTLIAIKYKG